jgi:hypothetical protein
MGFFPWCSEAAQEAGIFFCELLGGGFCPARAGAMGGAAAAAAGFIVASQQ